MKYFLATYDIQDGLHEYRGAFIIEAKTMKEAVGIAEAQDHDINTNEDEHKYFDFGDGMTASQNNGVTEISKEQMEFIERVRLAYRM
jgi:hypothetical protein